MKHFHSLTKLLTIGILSCLISGFTWKADPETDVQPESSSSLSNLVESIVKKKFSEQFSNQMAVETGVVEDGGQIPLPKFKDGTTARRDQCKYIVSPSTVNTVLFGWASSEGYYIVCKADSDGKVQCHLAKWIAGNLQRVEDPKNQYHTIFSANYLVIALHE